MLRAIFAKNVHAYLVKIFNTVHEHDKKGRAISFLL
jgi:hypothetical protein